MTHRHEQIREINRLAKQFSDDVRRLIEREPEEACLTPSAKQSRRPLMSDLKPCPFCGGVACGFSRLNTYNPMRRVCYVECSTDDCEDPDEYPEPCGARTEYYDTHEAAADAWNTRTPDPLLEEVLEVIGAYVSAYGWDATNGMGEGKREPEVKALLAKLDGREE